MPNEKLSVEQINAFQEIFDFFNDNLFDGKLPPVILNFSRTSGKKTIAFFKPKSWAREAEKDTVAVHELSLTPRFLNRTKKETFSTIVHEQCHLWQHHFGKASRPGYHNMEWAEKMLEVGLQPVSNSGGMTGQSVSHDIIADGKFDILFKTIENELSLPFLAFSEDTEKAPSSTRSKYCCERCQTNVYGKKNLQINCGVCNAQYKLEEK